MKINIFYAPGGDEHVAESLKKSFDNAGYEALVLGCITDNEKADEDNKAIVIITDPARYMAAQVSDPENLDDSLARWLRFVKYWMAQRKKIWRYIQFI